MAEATAEAEEEESSGDDDAEDAWRDAFDLALRREYIPQAEWAQKAKQVAVLVKSRVVKEVRWWDRSAVNPTDDDMYPLPHLTFTHHSGVHDFLVPPSACIAMASFLDDASNYSETGWLVLAGAAYAGYDSYPFVHAPVGQIAAIQQVRANPACSASQSLLLTACPLTPPPPPSPFP